ncbi:MAG: hypothetical protein IKI50_07830 [Clostridia bacterium]|nr:hypothetical protein [Clostridia bacterium]
MKKIALYLLAVGLLLSVTACGGNGDPSGSVDPASTQEPAHDLSLDWSFITEGDSGGLDTVGLYIWEANPSQYEFWKALGINTLQLCDRGWYYNANDFSLRSYLRKMADGVASAKQAGFKVYVILFSNIEQYKGPYPKEPTGIGTKFHPDDQAAMEDRLYYLKMSVEAMKEADGFTIFAGDPGGIPNTLGEGDVYDYINFCRQAADMIHETVPQAEININPWAVTMYETPNRSAMTAAFWLRETELTKIIMEEDDLLGESLGLELACHDYYRPLVLRQYFQTQTIPEQMFPTKDDITAVLNKGVRRMWAWPYFLLDEADDGDKGVNNTTLPQIESRYIVDYVQRVRQVGVNGAIGSWSWGGYKAKMLNTYAFARACHDATVTAEQILGEFAQAIATPDTRAALTEVLKYVENDSNHQKKLPVVFRKPNFECSLFEADEALALLETVQPNTNNQFPLAYSPKEYLKDLKARVELMKY